MITKPYEWGRLIRSAFFFLPYLFSRKKQQEYGGVFEAEGLNFSLLQHPPERIFHLLNPKRGRKIIDIGCGPGKYLRFLKDKGLEVYGIDISSSTIVEGKKSGLKNIEVTNIQKNPPPFKQKFDYFLLMEILEHLDQPEKAIKNILPKLKKDAIGIVTAPCFNLPQLKFLIPFYRRLRKVEMKKFDHKRIFSEKSLLKILKKYFQIEAIKYENFLDHIFRARFQRKFKFFDYLYQISSVFPFSLFLKYLGSSILIKVRNK